MNGRPSAAMRPEGTRPGARPGSHGIGSMESTSYTSAPSSWKMPLSPLYEAIASMRSRIESNSGPAVSLRTKRSDRA